MAQKRVNLQFVGTVLVAFVLLGCGLLALRLVMSKNATQLEKMGDERLAANDSQQALEYYSRALGREPRNVKVRMKIADVLRDVGRSTGDEQAQIDATRQWNEVLSIDPSNKDALERMMQFAVERVELTNPPQPRLFTNLKDVADKVLNLNESDPRYAVRDPKHPDVDPRAELLALKDRARVYQRISIVAAWLVGIEAPPQQIQENLDGLAEMLAKTPDNPDVAYYLCLGYIKQARELRIGGNPDDARDREKLAFTTFDKVVRDFDAAWAANPPKAPPPLTKTSSPDEIANKAKFDEKVTNSAVLHVRFSQVLRQLSTGLADDADEDTKDDRPAYIARMGEVLATARKQILDYPTNPVMTEVYREYVAYLDRNRVRLAKARARAAVAAGGTPSTAPAANGATTRPGEDTPDTLIAELYKNRPDDQDVRMMYAASLRNKKEATPELEATDKQEAIELLQKEILDPGTPGAMTQRSKTELQIQTNVTLINYLIDDFMATSDAAKRQQIRGQIDKAYDALAAHDPVKYYSLLTKGKIALLTHPGTEGAIEAIPNLERARDLLRVQYGPTRRDWQGESLLADAYIRSRQTGLAKAQLESIISVIPDAVVARRALAKLLIEEQDLNGARLQLSEIRKLEGPDGYQKDAASMAMESELSILDPTKVKPEELAKKLAEMPEGTADEIKRKILPTVQLGKIDEVVRLYEKLRGLDPANVDAVRTLVQIYSSEDKRDQAAKVVDEALAKAPDNVSLQLVRAQLDRNAEKVKDLTLKGLEGIKDPLTRELRLHDYYVARNDPAEALKHLDAAEKIDAENGTVMDVRFSDALAEHKWDVAQKYADRLGLKNADEAHGLIYRFRLCEARGDFRGAEDVARELVETFQQYARSWLTYGDALKRQGKYEEAVAKYQMALDRQTGNYDALRGIVESYLSMNPPRSQEAYNYIQEGRKVHPRDQWFKEQEINWLLTYSDDPGKALKPREEEAKAAPDKIGPQIALHAAEWEVAKQRLQQGKAPEAQQYFQKAHDGFKAVLAKFPGENLLAYAYFADICAQVGDAAGGEQALKDLAAHEKWKDRYEPQKMLGDYYARAGKSDVAEAAYAEALRRAKDAPDLRRQVANFYVNERKFDQAIQTLGTNPTDKADQQQLVQTYMAAGKWTDAEQQLDRMLKATPADANLLAMRGILMMQEQKFPQAGEAFAQALAADPRNASALYYRGMLRMRQGGGPDQVVEAIKDFTAARDATDPANTPGQVQTRTTLAEALRAHNQPEDAITELQTALRMQPLNKDLRLKLLEMLSTLLSPRWGEVERYVKEAEQMPEFAADPDWYRFEAGMWATRNQWEKSYDAIRKALPLTAGRPQQTYVLMQDYLRVLNMLKRYNDLYQESSALLKDPEVAQNGWWVYQGRAIALAKLDHKNEALGDFERALAITSRLRNDDGTQLVVNSIVDTIGLEAAIDRVKLEVAKGNDHWRKVLISLYMSQNDYARAETEIDTLLSDPNKLEPDERRVAYGIGGMTYMMAQHYPKARDAYEKLLALDPNDPIGLNNMACLYTDYLNPPDPAKALTYTKRAMDLMQSKGAIDPNVLDTHGWVLTRNKQTDEGINFIRESIERKPVMEAYYHYGVALLDKNLAPEAQQQLEKAQKMLQDRKQRGQPIETQFESRLAEALAKAKALVNGTSAGTQEPPKP